MTQVGLRARFHCFWKRTLHMTQKRHDVARVVRDASIHCVVVAQM
jgi:hypothetical protein